MESSRIKCEIAVLGGGAAGVTAAIAAARTGANVLLVEAQGCLGGTRTAGAVDTFYGFYTPGNSPRRIVGGIAWETVGNIMSQNACFERQNTYGAGTGITYDVETLKRVWEDMAQDAGVNILFYAAIFKADYINDTNGEKSIKTVYAAVKGKVVEIEADLFIDATGDADVVYYTGGEFIPLMDGETLQSLTTIFHIGNVDLDKALKVKHDELVALMKEAKESGRYNLPRLDGSFHKTTYPGVLQANMVRIPNVDASDPWKLSKAEMEGRRQAKMYFDFLKEFVPGFENSFLMNTAQHIGVRETRRVRGRYILTEQNVLEASKFEDGVACCAAPIEDHNAGSSTRWAYVGGDGVYQIPYRSLIPEGISNVIVAGRCLSATHGAQASARNTAQVMAMGQAAGAAAAIALREKVPYSKIAVETLADTLEKSNCILS